MGVYGLWKLLDASGKPVVVESLEGKVLAIDISIWMYQVLQGYQDRHGAPKPNAHLLGLFTRICKLLYHRIKPIFVFDGGVPVLKKNTIASRRKQKSIATSKAQKMKADLINNLIKHSMVKTVLNKDSKVDDNTNDGMQITLNAQNKHTELDMFALPNMPSISNVQSYVSDDEYDSDVDSVELSPRKQSKWMGNIHNVDITTNEFKALPADVRYDILSDLRETRKQNSWGRLHEMPEKSQEFSGFQMQRLLKRRHVQASLESAEKEMGGKTLTLEELDKLLTEQGVNTKGRDLAFRIAADSTTRLIYISDKNALTSNSVNKETETEKKDTLQNENEEIEPVAGPSNPIQLIENMNEYELNDNSDDKVIIPIYDDYVPIAEDINEYTFDSDWESETSEPDVNESQISAKQCFGKNLRNPALTYMLEYTGLSQDQIIQLINQQEKWNNKEKNHKITSQDLQVFEKNSYLKLTENINSKDDKSVVFKLSKNCEKIPKSIREELQSTQGIRMIKDDTDIELALSSPKSDTSIEVESLKSNIDMSEITVATNITNLNNEITEICSSPVTKPDDVTQIDTSDSDCDDFIEIRDVPIPDINVSKSIIKKENIEIIIKSDEKLENDIFADIFEKTEKNEITSTNCSEQKPFINTNDEYRTVSIFDNSDNIKNINNIKNSSLDVKPEGSIVEEINVKSIKNTELVDNISNDEDKTHDFERSDETTQQNNISSPDKDNSCTEHAKEKPIMLPTNEEDLIELKDQLEDEQTELTKSIGKLERQATNISDQIRIEAQELLRLFGIPYVIAPMEAEAQCAYLEQIKLTDGTITDDSDIWLFGGNCVYKNFFNNNKKVLQYHASNIQHHFKLTRNKLIQLALLVGSDYTTGVAGIGPVTALEILAAFPAEGDNVLHGLHNFSSWIKKGRVAAPGKTGLRNKLRNVKLDRDFPSQAVVQAYLFPTVDESKEPFTWGKPNAVLLCDYTRQKFGWTKGKFDDTMIPVLRRMQQSKSQKLLDLYFKAVPSKPIELSLSKRVQKAVYRLNNADNINEENTDDESQPKKTKRNNIGQKPKKEEKTLKPDISPICESETLVGANDILDMSAVPVVQEKSTKEYIPQREKDKVSALQKKLHAIEVLRKSKRGLAKTKKVKRTVRKIKREAELSESDSS